MINTTCCGCLFANTNNKQCYFDIPDLIKETKKIIEKPEGLYIEEYGCRYCFSKKTYEENEELQQVDIVQYVLASAKIKYYLIINLKHHKDELANLCDILSKLDIKPKYISFINKDTQKARAIADYLKDNLYAEAKWKLHNFVQDDPLQECITIALDTNMGKSDADIFLVYDPADDGLSADVLNSRINFLQIECIVKQRKFNAAIVDSKLMDGLAMSFSAYKFLILNINHDILKSIQETTNFTHIYYHDPIK
jgi:hypothetical protein